MELASFAIFAGRYIVTANKDGSIPLNSRVVAELVKGSANADLLEELMRRSNSANS